MTSAQETFTAGDRVTVQSVSTSKTSVGTVIAVTDVAWALMPDGSFRACSGKLSAVTCQMDNGKVRTYVPQRLHALSSTLPTEIVIPDDISSLLPEDGE